MKQVIIKKGNISIDEVPAPCVENKNVLVRVLHSCISVGTESSGIKAASESLVKKALKKPDLAKKAASMMLEKGFKNTINTVKEKTGTGKSLGYSAAGEVIGIGSEIKDISVKDMVACAGVGFASHAEVVSVPRNLVVKIPENIGTKVSSTVALGSISLQGVRRAQPTLGEWFVVIGLGLIGQITIQLLKNNGCRVIGSDLIEERCNTALAMGMDYSLNGSSEEMIDQVNKLTDGNGVDGVIITAAASSNEIISTAFQMCRSKGRVVLVGDVGLDIRREDIFKKELDFYISTSYGPGRYNEEYEIKGLDYPIGYVRWTENRNMQEYLRLIAEDKLIIDPLLEKVYPLEQATAAYASLQEGNNKPLAVILEYSTDLTEDTLLKTRYYKDSQFNKSSTKIQIALVGASSFAKSIHLPNISKLNNSIDLKAVVSKTGLNAQNIAKQYGANYATTDYQKVLDDPSISAILIATRHNLHTEYTIRALNANKHVFLEKPLAIDRKELETIIDFYDETNSSSDTNFKPMLQTGFNRRFSPLISKAQEVTEKRINPMIINYRVNAGYAPTDHWVHGEEGGGRNIGEACHFYDLFISFVGKRFISVEASAIKPQSAYYMKNDNFIATINFEDGSIANLVYTALGNKSYPKEMMDIYVDGNIITLNDYKELKIIEKGEKTQRITCKSANKGHHEELSSFIHALTHNLKWPIPLWQQIQATEISFLVEEKIME